MASDLTWFALDLQWTFHAHKNPLKTLFSNKRHFTAAHLERLDIFNMFNTPDRHNSYYANHPLIDRQMITDEGTGHTGGTLMFNWNYRGSINAAATLMRSYPCEYFRYLRILHGFDFVWGIDIVLILAVT